MVQIRLASSLLQRERRRFNATYTTKKRYLFRGFRIYYTYYSSSNCNPVSEINYIQLVQYSFFCTLVAHCASCCWQILHNNQCIWWCLYIESTIGMTGDGSSTAAIKPQQYLSLSLPLAKLFTLSRTASNHDFLISILLLAWWYDDSAAALTGKMLAVVALELERFGGW